MIGDVPSGAPLRCRFGHHKGQERGGLMVFTCPRCGGNYWQTDPRYRAAMDEVRGLEAVESPRVGDLARAGGAEAMLDRLHGKT